MEATAEIEDAAPPLPSEGGFDGEAMRRTKPGYKRLFLTLSVLLCFLLGFPFLFKSVEIYRSPLPFREIEELSAAVVSSPLHFPCEFRAVFVGFEDPNLTAEELAVLVQSQVRGTAEKDAVSGGSCSHNSTVSVTLDSGSYCSHSGYSPHWKCESLNELIRHEELGKHGDESFDEQLQFLLDDDNSHRNLGSLYTVLVVQREDARKARSLVGKYRHAWIIGNLSVKQAVKKVAQTFVQVFVNGLKEESSIGPEFMPVGADGRIVLSFSLLNANPHDWIYDWDFQAVDDNILTPIAEGLEHVADIKIESQVLYHTPKSSISLWDDKLRSHIFTKEDLPFFVNSNEWHLDTSVEAGGQSKILHFVVYVPQAKECPLQLRLPNGRISATNGFISPMWGGVVVWSPPDCLNSSMRPHFRQKISPEDMRKIFEVFTAQIRELFGLNSHFLIGDPSDSLQMLTVERGFAQWELDVLARQHTHFNLHQSITTLGSLSQLVRSLPRMIIKDEIGKQVKHSLEATGLALSNASDGVHDASVVYSRRARSFAEDAFYHPSVMSVSYFSFEHCFAVYSPFFLPVSLHVLLAALKEWKRLKQESNKYKAWKAKEP